MEVDSTGVRLATASRPAELRRERANAGSRLVSLNRKILAGYVLLGLIVEGVIEAARHAGAADWQQKLLAHKVLADAAELRDGFSALDAGRNEVYIREVTTGREWLCATDDLRNRCEGHRIVIAETRLRDRLEGCNITLHPLHAADSLTAVLRRLRDGASDVALTDANYVRGEGDIYAKPVGVLP